MHEFDTKDIKRLFGIPESQVRSLIKAGHIQPRKKAGRLNFSFQDLIVLRTAGSLRAARIPAQKINRTLREIRASLPDSLPLSGLSIVALGDRIVVREGQALRESDTGQYALAFGVVDRQGELLVIEKPGATAPPPPAANARPANGGTRANRGSPAKNPAPKAAKDPSAKDPSAKDPSANDPSANDPSANDPPAKHPPAMDTPAKDPEELFEQGLALEESEPRAAQAAYQACLAADVHHVEARLNLGRLLHVDGRLQEALEVYRGTDTAEALISYNLGVLLEDFERESDAVSAYREALALDPRLADAHFNLARLYERTSRPKDALRHLLAYRRLMNESGA
jgi:DNA-binding transcriptional MerR regulator